jgi:hypothetical protein
LRPSLEVYQLALLTSPTEDLEDCQASKRKNSVGCHLTFFIHS